MDLRVKVPISEKNEQRNKAQLCALQLWEKKKCVWLQGGLGATETDVAIEMAAQKFGGTRQ